MPDDQYVACHTDGTTGLPRPWDRLAGYDLTALLMIV